MGERTNILSIPLRPETSVYVADGEVCIYQSGQYDSGTVRLNAREAEAVRAALADALVQLKNTEGR